MNYKTIISILLLPILVQAEVGNFNFTLTDQQVKLMSWARENNKTKIDRQAIQSFEESTGKDYPDYKYFGLYDLSSYVGKELKVNCLSEKNYCELELYKKPEEKGALAKASDFIVGVTKSGACLVFDSSCDNLPSTKKKTAKSVPIAAMMLSKQDLKRLSQLFKKHKEQQGVISTKTTTGHVSGRKYTCKHITVYDDQPGANSCFTKTIALPGVQIVDDKKLSSSVSLFDNTNPFVTKSAHQDKTEAKPGVR